MTHFLFRHRILVLQCTKGAIAASRTPPWLASGWGCRGRHLSSRKKLLWTVRASLLRQPHPPHQLSKLRIGTQRVEQEIGFQTDQVEIALLISSVEPFESLIFVSQVGIELSNFVSRRVAGLGLSLSEFNAFSQSALPAC